MKSEAVWFVGPGRVEVREIEVPDPLPHEVQVEVKASGLCMFDVYNFSHGENLKYPFVAGHEGAGVITKVGLHVQGVKEGTRVAAGGFAHHTNTSQIIPLPEKGEFEHLILEPVACCVNGVTQCEVKPGDRVGVVGAGFMGLGILQILGHSPLAGLYAAEPDPARRRLAERFGAQTFARAEELPTGLDVVFECAGVQGVLDASSRLLRNGGTLCMFAWHHGTRTIDTDFWHLHGIRALNASPMISEYFHPFWGRAARLIERGIIDLRPLVTHAFPAARCQELFEIAAARKDGYIKGVVTF